MPQTTTLRRASTFLVGALFAVVFVCSGASATHGAVTRGESAVGAHTATSKAAVRTVHHTTHSHKSQAPALPDLASTGPTATDDSPVFAVDVAEESLATQHSHTLFTTSERAPPAL
ncbi:MAG: hypothetical protein M3Q98_11060 [Actinomycetota bacterium]|nr:hypothetical protein [Actinomycetota bacterium]